MELTEEYLQNKMPQILQTFEEFEIEDKEALIENFLKNFFIFIKISVSKFFSLFIKPIYAIILSSIFFIS